MGNSMLTSLDGIFRSFFASLATSISYDVVFYAALAVELFIIFVFAIKSRFSYEIRMTKSLDKLNRWLFHHKSITKDNIKEFTMLIKRAPKRLTYNWQQYILYRDKAPSEYTSVENLIEKPLRTSSYSLNVRNLNIISFVWTAFVFVVSIAFNNATTDTVLSTTILLSVLVVPVIIGIILVFTNIIFSAKKSSNLDLLYQNLHLFNRFLDNACVDLPKYIDYSLLFTNQEIERGIPELREYYESRARKEKEEFERVQEQEEKLEQYDFSAVGIDGSNILERALKECEIYLNKKAKILTNISERESSLDSLKKNFDNIQKEFQKKMQVSKENIDRLRQQQEETTSRIEGNFLRRQMDTTIQKQEQEEAEYENQKRSYLSQQAEYEEQIKNFNLELERLKGKVSDAMESEYETFYEKLFKTSVVEAQNQVKDKYNNMREERDNYEEELTDVQTKLKRLVDENEILRNKLGITETSEILAPVEPEIKEKKKKERKPQEDLVFDEIDEGQFKHKEEKPQEDFVLEEEEEPAKEEVLDLDSEEEKVVEEEVPAVEEDDDSEYDFDDEEEEIEESEEDDETEEENEEPEENVLKPSEAPKKGRGRPKGSVKEKKEVPTGPKKGRGRPKGATQKTKPTVTDAPKKGRGRPKKAEGLDIINKKISEEEQKMIEAQKNLNSKLTEVVSDLDKKSMESIEREKLLAEIKELKAKVKMVKESDSSANDQIEALNTQIENLLQKINQTK